MENVVSEMSPQIDQIALGLSEAQAELDTAKKENSGYGYKYSDLATVIATAKPVLAKHGLAIVQLVGQVTETSVSLTTILTHKSGQFFKSTASIPLVEMKGCNAAQSAGSSLSYLRRYSYQAILGMASEDNDASSEGFKRSELPTKVVVSALPAEVNTAPVVEQRTKFVRQKKTEVSHEI